MDPRVEALRTRDREPSLKRRRDRLASRYPTWEPLSLSGHFERCAQQWPDRPFVIVEGRVTTYAEFFNRVLEIAGRLAAQGIGRLDHVGVLLGNSVDFYATKIAAARLGARALSLNYLLRTAELAKVVRASECCAIVFEPKILDVDVVELLNGVHSALGHASLVRHFLSVESPDGTSATSPAFPARSLDQLPQQMPVPDLSAPDDIAELMFTSGSSGQSKGVLVRTHNFLGEGYGTALGRGLDEGWVSITALPPFHVFGYIEGMMPLSFVGGCLVLQRKFDADAQLAAVETYQADDILAVPAMTNRLVERATATQADLSSLRALFSAGNAVSAEWWARVKRVLRIDEVTTGYGLTEAAGTAALVRPDDPIELLTTTVGRLNQIGVAGIPELGGQRFYVRIVDHTTGEEVSDGEAGEIQLKGPSVMPGYWKMPEETAAAFQDGWLRTGDQGKLREDGALVLTGRIKELYKTGGELVSPQEVEDVLATLPGVAQVFVVGVPDERWGESGCAYVVRAAGSELSADDVVAYAKQNLARYKVPRHVMFIDTDDVPTSPSGKFLKRALAERAAVEVAHIEARSATVS